MRKKATYCGLAIILLLTIILAPGCSSIKDTLGDPVVRHCAAQTIGGAVLGGVAATTLADSKSSKAAAAAIGSAAGGTAGFLLCRRAFKQAQEMKQRLAALEEQQQQQSATSSTEGDRRASGEGTVLPDGDPPSGPMPSEGGGQRVVENLEVVDNRAIRLDLNSSLMFPSGQATLQPDAHAHLDVLAMSLEENPESEVVLIGHTDNVGSAEANKRLSEQRAEAVAAYLTDKGIGRERLETEGLGESEPIADNAMAEGRAQNRRVEVVIVPTTSEA